MKRKLADISAVDSPEAADAFAAALVGEDAEAPGGRADALLAAAAAAYLADGEFVLPAERRARSLLQMLSMIQAVENRPDFEHPLDMLFEELETGRYYFDDGGFVETSTPRPDHPALQRYRKFKQEAKTPAGEYAAAARLRALVLTLVAEEEAAEDGEE